MENPKKQLLERIKTANNVLVTVSTNPSVDQLSAAIGLTLMLNKMGKHATAVFSGEVPSTIEFLQPEKTLEKNTDSLRDFIIALDKSKADKLRYKVEDSHVKIFITPYRTSISQADLDFSQGDFNVEVVVALGVSEQKDLDKAITAHGRILHDATTISVTTGAQSNLGAINWADSHTSSLCEMVASLANALQENVLDGQMATAFMTGIVAETERFSNEKTSPDTMSISAALMAAGANQQLVASKLQEGQQAELEVSPSDAGSTEEAAPSDGSLQIEHSKPDEETPLETDAAEDAVDDIAAAPEQENTAQNTEPSEPETSLVQGGSSLILEPPTLGGKWTANTEPEQLDPATDPLGAKEYDTPLLSHQDKSEDTQQEQITELPEVVPESPAFTEPTPEPSSAPAEEPQIVMPAEDSSNTPEQENTAQNESPDITTLPSPSEASISPAEVVPAIEVPDNSSPDEAPPVQTLSDLEAAVRGAYDDSSTPTQDSGFSLPEAPVEPIQTDTTPLPEGLDQARDAVSEALANSNEPLPPITALNAQPLDLDVQQTGENGYMDQPLATPPEFTMPENLVPPTDMPQDTTAAPVEDPTAPPTVPPPLPPDMYGTFGTAPQNSDSQDDNNSSDPGSSPQNNIPPQSPNPFNLPPA